MGLDRSSTNSCVESTAQQRNVGRLPAGSDAAGAAEAASFRFLLTEFGALPGVPEATDSVSEEALAIGCCTWKCLTERVAVLEALCRP